MNNLSGMENVYSIIAWLFHHSQKEVSTRSGLLYENYFFGPVTISLVKGEENAHYIV